MKSGDEKKDLQTKGYLILDSVFNGKEIERIIGKIDTWSIENSGNKDQYAIRSILQEIPQLKEVVFNQNIKDILNSFFGAGFFITRSIYFNKLSSSNWFVSFHQDLSIHVFNKSDIIGFKNWTKKDDHIGVQPPNEVLESTFTIRIHLDDCDDTNGALRIIEGSHLHGVLTFDQKTMADEMVCNIPAGGVMIMKPLLFHASRKNTSGKSRRVIHLEFCNKELPEQIGWAEKEIITY